jgi:hypothetical protein
LKSAFELGGGLIKNFKAFAKIMSIFHVRSSCSTRSSQDGSLVVNNQTLHLYKFWDATAFAEYLYDCVAETIRTDLKEEIGFLRVFDAAIRATMDIVDMPDRRASLLVQLILQNDGRLSQAKRATFSELTDEEISAIEAAVASSSKDAHSN